MLHSWVDSINEDIIIAESMLNTSGFNNFFHQCSKILVKTMQHFIYSCTDSFPQDTSIDRLFQQSVQLENKITAYSVGISHFQLLQGKVIPTNVKTYPSHTSRLNYLNFCREFNNFILKILEKKGIFQ